MANKNAFVIVAAFTLMLSIGLLALFMFMQPKSSHQEVISAITIRDVSKGMTLEPQHISTNSLVWLTAIPVSGDVYFSQGETYSQSLWVWKSSSGDIDFAATVWGPDETGRNYYVELGRLSGRTLQITFGATTVVYEELTEFSTMTHPGYTILKVTLLE